MTKRQARAEAAALVAELTGQAKPVFTHGNTKLPAQTMIFNMGPASNGAKGRAFRMQCPEYLRGFCQLADPEHQCYTVKAERQYKNTRHHRRIQRRFWARCTAEQFVEVFRAESTRNTSALRFNEASGINTAEDVTKVMAIARALPELPVYIYTSRIDLWQAGAFNEAPENLTVNGSGFMAHNAFRARPANKIPAGAVLCGMDCKRCSLCQARHGIDIYAPLH